MPTIEFHGYSSEEAERLAEKGRGLLGDLPFRQDIVFVLPAASRVLGWDGTERPFLRVLSRYQERADQIRDRLVGEADVEVVLIGFTPRRERARP